MILLNMEFIKFHGIPWNFKKSSMESHGTFFGKIKSSMEFHGTREYGKKFHGIPWNFGSGENSMELLVSAKLAHFKFHGIPWNYSCQRNWRTPSSMELLVSATLAYSKFHGTAGVSSMEFHGTFFCYLLEPLVSSMHWVLKWYKIPWNLSFKILMKMVFNCAGWINFHKLINTL